MTKLRIFEDELGRMNDSLIELHCQSRQCHCMSSSFNDQLLACVGGLWLKDVGE